MTTTDPTTGSPTADTSPSAESGAGHDADADARFAEYMADIASHVDDPQDGELFREFLEDDPENQRALFDLVEAINAPRPATPWTPFGVTIAVICLAAVVVVIALLAWMLR